MFTFTNFYWTQFHSPRLYRHYYDFIVFYIWREIVGCVLTEHWLAAPCTGSLCCELLLFSLQSWVSQTNITSQVLNYYIWGQFRLSCVLYSSIALISDISVYTLVFIRASLLFIRTIVLRHIDILWQCVQNVSFAITSCVLDCGFTTWT